MRAAEDAISSGIVDLTLRSDSAAAPTVAQRSAKETGAIISAALASHRIDATAASGARFPATVAATVARSAASDTDAAAGSSAGALAPLASLAAAAAAASSPSRAAASQAHTQQRATARLTFSGLALGTSPSPFARVAAFAVVVPRGGANPGLAGAGGAASAAAAVGVADGVKTEEELAAEREAELERLQAAADAAAADARELAAAHANLISALPSVHAQLRGARAALAELERGFIVRRECLDMLPDAPAHLQRLAESIRDQTAGLLALAAEWDGVRLPLIAAIRERLAAVDAEEAAFTARAAASAGLQADMSALLVGQWEGRQSTLRGTFLLVCLRGSRLQPYTELTCLCLLPCRLTVAPRRRSCRCCSASGMPCRLVLRQRLLQTLEPPPRLPLQRGAALRLRRSAARPSHAASWTQ